MKIELQPWEHTCEDGCCFRTGYDVFLNGNKIGSTEGEDAEELANILNDHYSETESLKDSISFAEFIISDYEIVVEGKEKLLWQLCGTKQRYTSSELYERFLNSDL